MAFSVRAGAGRKLVFFGHKRFKLTPLRNTTTPQAGTLTGARGITDSRLHPLALLHPGQPVIRLRDLPVPLPPLPILLRKCRDR